MSDLQGFLDDVKSGVTDLLKEFVTSRTVDIRSTVQGFVNRSAEDLKRWTAMLAQGQLTERDYRSLVAGIGGLAEMAALKELGLTKARSDELKGRIIDTVVGSALRLVG